MFTVVFSDGRRWPLGDVEEVAALRCLVRSQGEVLEGGAQPVSRCQALAALGLGRDDLAAEYDKAWRPPSGAEVFALLKVASLTSGAAARLVGVPSAKMRRWCGDDGSMPYAVWRLLLVYCRLTPPLFVD